MPDFRVGEHDVTTPSGIARAINRVVAYVTEIDVKLERKLDDLEQRIHAVERRNR